MGQTTGKTRTSRLATNNKILLSNLIQNTKQLTLPSFGNLESTPKVVFGNYN